ncbi:MAG: helix-turn-helix transcriptional regulator [Planctomycetota bacterium]
MKRLEAPNQYITLEEVAKLLSYSTRTIRRLMGAGQIPFYRPAGNPRFVLEEVHRAIQMTANKKRRRKNGKTV